MSASERHQQHSEAATMNSSNHSSNGARILPDDFIPSEMEVVCGRGPTVFKHPGNVRFRRMVDECLQEYSDASTKMEKTFIVREIIAQIRASSEGGVGFVKKDASSNGCWYQVDDNFAREKTTQAFRDALFDRYKSSNTAKKLKKRALRRAYSSASLLGAKKSSSSSTDTKSSSSYSNPLIAKLRMHKSKPSSSALDHNNKSWSRMGASCPNLGLTAPKSSSSASISDGCNSEWGAPSALLNTISSGSNFDWGNKVSVVSSSTFDLNNVEKKSGNQDYLLGSLDKLNNSQPSLAETEADSVSDGSSAALVAEFANGEQQRRKKPAENVDVFDQMVDMVCDVQVPELDDLDLDSFIPDSVFEEL